MEFSFTPEQTDLRELVRTVLGKQAVRSREPGSYDSALWRRLAVELGLTGLATDQGLGVELAIVLEETGRALLALPYLTTAVAARFLPPPLWSPETIATIHCGSGLVAQDWRVYGDAVGVVDGDIASAAVVAAEDDDGLSLYAVPLGDVARTPASTLDPSRPGAALTFNGTPATRVAASPEEVLDALHLALAVESLGVASASLEATLTHLRTRHQFGQPLASFQALRHRVADLAVALEAATSTTWYAVRSDRRERPVLAPMAKLVAADAAYAITAESIQLHGGIGFTWEHDAHRYFKRATVTRLNRDPTALRRMIAERARVFRY